MPNSLRCMISKLRHKGQISDAEYKELITKLENHDRVIKEQTNTAECVKTCNECKHQKAIFHKDKRFKEGGYTYYQCELNSDPFVQHVVDGQPYQYCSEAEMKDKQNIGWRCGWEYIHKKEENNE